MATNNNIENVTAGKPKVTGAVYVAASTVTPPTDASTDLAEDFACIGYLSDDGVQNKIDEKTSDTFAWGTDLVLTASESRKETFEYTMLETSLISLQQAFGETNVTQDATSKDITVKHNGLEKKDYVYVIEYILSNDRIMRTVIPVGRVISLDTIKYVDKEPVGYAVTIGARSDSSGNTAYNYIASTASAS